MKLHDNETYQKCIQRAAESSVPWEQLSGKRILIAGATGLIGRCMIDILMHKNRQDNMNCSVTALSRNEKSAREYLDETYFDSLLFRYVSHDVRDSICTAELGYSDYVLHFASNTHPVAYAERPIDTIITNIYGTKNLLDYCVESNAGRFIFCSSVEIYGENRGDRELFDEKYLGYLDSNTLRAGYPESKRAGEVLCQGYIREKNVDVVIPRLPRVFGPTMREEDSKAVAQFIKMAVQGKDIVLKSEGKQFYSFLHVVDAVTGILTVMLKGKRGEAYNIADESCDATLREMAETTALYGQSKVTYAKPGGEEQRGYSTATKARMDGRKIRELGWKPLYTIQEGLRETISIGKLLE